MGKPAGVPPTLGSITHFSHPHPLHLSNANFQCCSVCKHEASSGTVYTCTMCNYSLHQKCSQMPQKITHPFDSNNHVLSLLTKPAYPEGFFNCDACGDQGNGFSYQCQTCGIDLHILCASLPLLFTHHSHHHQLSLTFYPPYPTGTFTCDICRHSGSKTWLYRCSICEFDVHLTCVKVNGPVTSNRAMSQPPSLISREVLGPVPVPPPQMANNMAGNFPNQGMNPVPVGYNNSFTPPAFQPQPQFVSGTPNYHAQGHYRSIPQNNFMHHGSVVRPPFRPAAGYAQQNTMTNQIAGGVANGIASGASQAVAQALIQGMFGGGAGGVLADSGSYIASDQGGYTQMDGGYEGGGGGGGGDTSTTY